MACAGLDRQHTFHINLDINKQCDLDHMMLQIVIIKIAGLNFGYDASS